MRNFDLNAWLTAMLAVADDISDLNFSVGYAIPFEWAVDYNDELRDEDHIADADFFYHATDKLQFFDPQTERSLLW